jgi:hypothetical protein
LNVLFSQTGLSDFSTLHSQPKATRRFYGGNDLHFLTFSGKRPASVRWPDVSVSSWPLGLRLQMTGIGAVRLAPRHVHDEWSLTTARAEVQGDISAGRFTLRYIPED